MKADGLNKDGVETRCPRADIMASWGWMVRAAPADMDLLRRCF